MEDKFMAVLEKLDKVSDEVNVNAVFGAPQTIEGRVLIPVAAVSYGIAAGAGSPGTCMGAAVDVECEEDCCAYSEEECDCENPDECDCECGCHETEECTPAEGVGGASGGNARPIAVIEVTKDGATVKPINNEQLIALAGIALSAWAVGWIGLVLKTIFSPRK